jgi:hypothetical protein
MPVPVSSLSIAIQGIADFLDAEFGEDVDISTETPAEASKRAKGGNKHLLNIFAYRIMPSGFHASTGSDEPLFIRINAMLTPFVSDQGTPDMDTDLRILGHGIRLLHSRPVVPGELPKGDTTDLAPTDKDPTKYRLQAVLLAPTAEELNNIWTTQGGDDLPYRLSAVYEFALIPIEPLEHRVENGPVTSSVLDLAPNLDARDEKGFIPYGEEPIGRPLGNVVAGKGPPPDPPTGWLPVVLIADNGVLRNEMNVAAGTASIDVAIAGPPGEDVALEVHWVRANSDTDAQNPQVKTIATPRIDDAGAITQLNLTNLANGDKAVVRTRPVGAGNQPIPESPFANTLTLIGVP